MSEVFNVNNCTGQIPGTCEEIKRFLNLLKRFGSWDYQEPFLDSRLVCAFPDVESEKRPHNGYTSEEYNEQNVKPSNVANQIAPIDIYVLELPIECVGVRLIPFIPRVHLKYILVYWIGDTHYIWLFELLRFICVPIIQLSRVVPRYHY